MALRVTRSFLAVAMMTALTDFPAAWRHSRKRMNSGAHREVHGVEPICKVLPIAPSTYHEHAARRSDPEILPPRAKRDIRLRAEIRRVWTENFQVYGVRKVWRQLDREGVRIVNR